MQHRLLLLWAIVALSPYFLAAQDPFSTHFFNNQSDFNPALTGFRGALSVDLKLKTQWGGPAVAPFQSGSINVEESLPCSILDYGLHFNFDEEGDGRFRTYDGGFRFAGTIPFETADQLHNIRLGGSLQWSYKTVDFSRLVFSDQLDPKYGNIFGTSFVPPNVGASNVFFTPAVGFAYRGLFNKRSSRATAVSVGLSLHNAYSLGADALGNEESILGIGTKIPPRFAAFAEAEFVPYASGRSYFSVRPLVLYQRQSRPLFGEGGSLRYVEMGSRFSLNRVLTAGVFYHFTGQHAEEGFNTNWLTFSLETGMLMGGNRSKRIDLGFAYSNNFTGLSNAVGPIFEASISIHLRRSPSCELMGMPGTGAGQAMPCPTMRSTSRRKLYENIWYQ
jgi:type IX secretion system PorP/SprF family membrane protein